MMHDPVDQGLMSQLIGYHCRRAFVAVEPFSHERMAQYGLRPAEFAVLGLLHANPALSQKQVAQGINVAPPNLAPILDRLEARGLITRERDSADRRVHAFSLTPQGLSLCISAEKTVLELENEAAAGLTPEERRQLIRLLQRLYLPTEETGRAP